MTFFDLRVAPKVKKRGSSASAETLNVAECNACPLNPDHGNSGLINPYMKATGAKRPLVYMLGEAPGEEEDKLGKQFVGRAGQTLREFIPPGYDDQLRWNNVVQCRPPANATPGFVESECCRMRIVRDIERTKPKAIFGFGNVPLNWAVGQNGITNWRGRHMPVRVGKHVCWFFPMFHPSYVMRMRNAGEELGGKSFFEGQQIEFVFERDLRNGFKLTEKLPEATCHDAAKANDKVRFVTGKGRGDFEAVLEFLDECATKKVVGIDFETKGVRPYAEGAKLLSCALSHNHGTLAFPLDHRESGWNRSERQMIWEHLGEFMLNAPCKKVAHHLAFELEWAAHFWSEDIVRSGKWEDTLSQAYILDERLYCFSLEFLSILNFGLNIKSLAQLDKAKLDDEPLADVLLYNGVDAKYHRLLYLAQSERLLEDGLMPVYREQLRRVPTMVLTQLQGLPVDQTIVKTLHKQYTKKIEKIEAEIAAMPEVKAFKRKIGHEFRPSAPHDVAKAVKQIIGKPTSKVNEEALKEINHPLTNAVLKWRSNHKVVSVYIKPVMKGSPLIYPDGKLHPIITTSQTRTWRTASESPNIQNWPKHDTGQVDVRKQITPGPGWKIVSIDYGQIQARNVGMESLDKTLCKSFWDRHDIHGDWTRRVLKRYPRWVKGGAAAFEDKVTFKKFRSKTKNAVFGLFFGAKAKKVAFLLDVPIEVAEEISTAFWDQFPGVLDWHKRLEHDYRKLGYVTGATGFRRRAPCAHNEMINAPIQADEAAIVCDAMCRLSVAGFQASMIIHDDLTFMMPEDEVEDQLLEIIPIMLDVPYEWARVVPTVIEVSTGDSWYELKEFGNYASDQWKGKLR